MTDDAVSTKKERKPRQASIDQEAHAIAVCWKALMGVADDESRTRVLEYLRNRLGLA